MTITIKGSIAITILQVIAELLKLMPASTIVFGTHGNANYKRVCVYKGILLKSYSVVL